MTRFHALVLFLAVSCVSACRDATEEERLRDEVDVLETHLYVALKLAVAGSEDDPKVQNARAALLRVSEGVAGEQDHPSARGDLAAAADVTTALWMLREMGSAEVSKWHESRVVLTSRWLQPPAAVNTGAEERAVILDHAILLLGLTALRLHPRAPVPVPNTAVLYEAYLMGDQPLEAVELDNVARSAQALAFSRNGYCSMAADVTARLAQNPPQLTGKELEDAAQALMGLGRAAAHAPPAAGLGAALILAQNLPWVARLLAFASTAQCLTESDLPDRQARSFVQWEHALDTAEQAGFTAAELGFLRAYLAYGRGDRKETQRQLERARESSHLTEDEKSELNTLITHFDEASQSQMKRFLDSVFVSAWLMRLVHHRLENSGFYDHLRQVPALEVASRVLGAVDLERAARLADAGWVQSWVARTWRAVVALLNA